LFLGVSSLTRLVLAWIHAVDGSVAEIAPARIFATGCLVDLAVVPWLLAGAVLFLSCLPGRALRERLGRAAVSTATWVFVFALLFVAAVEGFFFAEFDGRFNFVAVDYLVYPTEVVTNVWQSYPTAWILCALALLAAGLTALSALRLGDLDALPPSRRTRAAVALAWPALLAVAPVALPSGASLGGGSRAFEQLADNGYRTFALALLGADAPYEGLYADAPPREVFDRLRRLLAPGDPASSLGEDGTTRRHVEAPGPARRMNVVVVLEESFGSEFVGRVTPEFDRLAEQGVFFRRAMSTGNRTIRAIEATTSGLPPLPGISIVRRTQSRDLFTLPSLLAERGYQTLFVYGGRALFDGMGSYLTANGVGRVVDQDDFPRQAFRTAWGVADEAIFDRALDEMDAMAASGRPFYTLLLTTSNHRPFLFPEEEVRRDARLTGRENAVRYADWALGRFFDAAKRHAFYDDTLFAVMGDHGARVYGASSIPLDSYRVPLLFLAPRVLEPRREDSLASLLDVPPTVMGVLGDSYESRFFGRDLLGGVDLEGRALMTHNSSIALLREGRLAVLGLRGSTELFDCGASVPLSGTAGETDCSSPATVDARGRELIADAVAYFAGADRVYRSGAYLSHATRGGA
jgi:phosphoglycerol transferase MdoB-like AlkP superfamily enzyme